MDTHSSIPVWRIPWTEEPNELQSMGSQRLVHNGVINTFEMWVTFSLSLLSYKFSSSHYSS